MAALAAATAIAESLPPVGITGHDASSQEAPIQFEIKSATASIHKDQDLSVSITLRNTGKNEQQLGITSCSSAYPSMWSADNPDVHVEQVSCLRKENFVLRLKPAETYDRTISIRISPAAAITGKPLKETFRLGFFPSGIPMQNVGTWSNAITVVVNGASPQSRRHPPALRPHLGQTKEVTDILFPRS